MSTPAKAPQLKQTKEYRLFKFDPTNRPVGKKVKKIIASMKVRGFLPAHPIACVPSGSAMAIKDGQHRFEAAKSLGIAVWYVCSREYENVSIAGLNKDIVGAWTPYDYIGSFKGQGKADYLTLQQFMDETKLPAGCAASLLYGQQANSGNALEAIRSGTFKVRDIAYARQVANVMEAARKHVPWSRHASFIEAISKCARVASCKTNLLAEKINNYPFLLRLQPTVDGYLDVLDEVYNYHSRDKIPLKFLATEASKKRQAAMPGR